MMDEYFLQVLVKTGRTINVPRSLQNLCGNVVLHNAAALGKHRLIKYLVRLGIHCSVVLHNKTPIFRAVKNGHVRAVRSLLKKGANVHEKHGGFPLIYIAATRGHADVVEALIIFGADLNYEEPSGHPVIYRAAERSDIDTVSVFLEYKAKLINSANNTLYHIAISEDCAEAIICLASLDVDINETDNNQRPPLYTAALAGKFDLVMLLLANNADLDARDYRGKSFLHIAAQEGEVVAATTLLDVGMDINIRGNFWGWTPLHTAVKYKQMDIVKLLVERNADIHAKTTDGKTIYDISKRNCDDVMCVYIAMLLKK